MKKRIAIAVIIIAAVALGLMNVINAEDNVKITPRYYLENDKITISTEFSNYEVGEEIVYAVKDTQGQSVYFDQLTYGGSPVTRLYTVPDEKINGGSIAVNHNSEYTEKEISFSKSSTVTFRLANGTYAVCTAENGRIRTFNSGTFKLCEDEKVTVKIESNSETSIISAKVNNKQSDDLRITLEGNGADILVETESEKKENNILRVSDCVTSDELFNIYGVNLNGDSVKVFIDFAESNKDFPDANSFVADVVGFDKESGTYITARMPKLEKGGQLKMWVQVDGAYYLPYYINTPRPQWLVQEKMAHGQTNKIIGRNLSPQEFNSAENVRIKLENDNGIYYPEIIDGDSYEIEFSVDDSIPVGNYTVAVSNGNNIWRELEYVEYGKTLEVIGAVSDPIGLNVWWAGDINWSNVINVSGKTTSDIQNAIKLAYYTGGGVVKLSEGIYEIDQIALYDGVVLQGAGKDKTILDCNGNSWIYIRGGHLTNVSDEGLMGVCDLSMRLTGEKAKNATVYPDTVVLMSSNTSAFSKTFVKNCDFSFPLDNPSEDISNDKLGRRIPVRMSGESDGVIENCTTVSRYLGFHVTTKKRVIMKDNHCTGITGHIYGTGELYTFENNTTLGNDDVEIVQGQHEGIVSRAPSYIKGNTVDNVGIEGQNDGETILAETAGAYVKMHGNIVSADANYCVVDGTFRNWDMNDQKWGRWQLVIVEGRGLGQVMPIQSMDEATRTVTFYDGWKIVPDQTSKFIVTTIIKGMTVVDNYTANSKKGIWLYNGCCDSVVAGNTTYNTQGIYVRGFAGEVTGENADGTGSTVYKDFYPSYFNSVENNNVSGVSDCTGDSSIGSIAVIGSGVEPLIGVLCYGSEIKNNSVNPEGKTNVVNGAESADMDGIYLGHHCVIRGREGTAYLAGIAEGNTVKNANTGIGAGGDVHEDLTTNRISMSADLTRGVVLRNNTFENVKEEYSINTYSYDTKKYSFAPIDVVEVVHNGVATNPVPSIIFNGNTELAVKNGLLDITFEVKNINEKPDITVYAAVYDEHNKLIRIYRDSKNIVSGHDDKFSLSMDLSDCENIQGYTLKVFVWDNSTNKPLTNKCFVVK